MYWMVCGKCRSIETGGNPEKVPVHVMLQDRLGRSCLGSNGVPSFVGTLIEREEGK